MFLAKGIDFLDSFNKQRKMSDMMCVCVFCVCVRKRERERERQRKEGERYGTERDSD